MYKIELLYFDGCPSWQKALQALEEVLKSGEITAKISLVQINSPERAQAEHFLGSPSFRVNGVDLWPEERSQYTLSCRLYQTPHGLKGSPTVEMLMDEIYRYINNTPQ
jgi:hypothetical protein